MPVKLDGRELRLHASKLEVRAASDGKPSVLAGYAAVFNSWSVDLWGFRERILPGAFTRALTPGADVRCLWNHDPSQVLARTKSKTLRLSQDAVGLAFEMDLPSHELGIRAAETIGRGDVDQMSFQFRTIKDSWKWSEGDEKLDERDLIEVELFEISPVTFPAYEETMVSARSAREVARSSVGVDAATRARRLRLAETG